MRIFFFNEVLLILIFYVRCAILADDVSSRCADRVDYDDGDVGWIADVTDETTVKLLDTGNLESRKKNQ